MQQSLIFQPVLVLVALTLVMYARLVFARMAAVKNKQVSAKYYRLLQGDTQPDKVAAMDRNIVNLFELPVLFYAAALVAYVTASVDAWLLALAWLFALSRVAHSVVHTTSNQVMQRLKLFVVGYLALIAIWAMLAWRLI